MKCNMMGTWEALDSSWPSADLAVVLPGIQRGHLGDDEHGCVSSGHLYMGTAGREMRKEAGSRNHGFQKGRMGIVSYNAQPSSSSGPTCSLRSSLYHWYRSGSSPWRVVCRWERGGKEGINGAQGP